MRGCVHHWRQEPGDLGAPFTCLRCGAARTFETNYFVLMDGRENSYSFRRKSNGDQQMEPMAVVAQGPESQVNEEAEASPNPKVLVVDDEAITGLMVKRLLERELACEVETALNGRQALEKAERLHPDLTLLDIRMPDMDGFEVCRRIKGNPLTAPSAIVYFSAYPRPDGELNGAEAYLNKPLEPSVLLRTVTSLVA